MDIQALETFFLSLLVLVTVTVAWFAGYIVYRLFKS
ncbi:hypothetical protein FB389_1101 [Rarobacter incanus]|uniref:Uncharacterized protein n=1 Tax=Rarobacter incanus TaxID=153494 RepID=A0A542SP81_9MICO|nr:hypothetical protein FB389_1101 [Rarobacter incanus]